MPVNDTLNFIDTRYNGAVKTLENAAVQGNFKQARHAMHLVHQYAHDKQELEAAFSAEMENMASSANPAFDHLDDEVERSRAADTQEGS